MFQMIYLIVTLAFLALASYFDLKTRELPIELTYSMLAIGLILHSLESVLSADLMPFVASFSMAAFCFVFSYALYKVGVWAGGDVKLFAALGASLPYFGSILFFPFVSLAASLAAIFPLMIIYVLYQLFADKRFNPYIRPLLEKTAVYAIVGFVTLSVINFLFSQSFEAFNYVVFAVISSLFFLFFNCYFIARKYVLRESKKTAELVPGDILAQNLVKRNGRYLFEDPSISTFGSKDVLISALDAGGVELSDIALFKKLKIKSVELKKSLPFVPVFFLGAVIVSLLEMLL